MRPALLIALFALLLLPGTAPAVLPDVPTPSPPSIGAPSYILIDHDSGTVLAERDPDTEREPASLVKLMTAYVVFNELREGHLELQEEVTISETAWRMGGSRMFVEVGRRVQVEDLLRGMIVQSGNDASVALAEHIAGNEETFAQIMNQQAAELGMDNTTFRNATGWPHAEQRTTARDIATLAMAMIRDFPEYYAYYSEPEFTYNGITQRNRNSLLHRDESVDGLKTGHTSGAGYNLVSSAKRDDMRLVSVVLGTDGPTARMEQTRSLFNYGFRFFGTLQVYDAGETVTEPKLWRGDRETVPLGLRAPLHVTIPRRASGDLEATMTLPETILAPLAEGDEVGTLTIRVGETEIASAPLVALEDRDEGGFFGRTLDDLLLRFR